MRLQGEENSLLLNPGRKDWVGGAGTINGATLGEFGMGQLQPGRWQVSLTEPLTAG